MRMSHHIGSGFWGHYSRVLEVHTCIFNHTQIRVYCIIGGNNGGYKAGFRHFAGHWVWRAKRWCCTDESEVKTANVNQKHLCLLGVCVWRLVELHRHRAHETWWHWKCGNRLRNFGSSFCLLEIELISVSCSRFPFQFSWIAIEKTLESNSSVV